VTAICLFSGFLAFGQNTIKKEIDIGMSDLETIRPLLKNALSPAGKFVLLPGKGTVMVIDTPSGIVAAEEAIQGAALPQADVALDFQFVTGLPGRKSITVAQEVPFPTAYAPPQIIVGPNGRYTVIPATPTEFRRRNIGVTSETVSTVNPDGSITMDIHTEHTEFEGFINYGSAILPAGGVGTIPVNGAVGGSDLLRSVYRCGSHEFSDHLDDSNFDLDRDSASSSSGCRRSRRNSPAEN
jgi:hypothetical protein